MAEPVGVSWKPGSFKPAIAASGTTSGSEQELQLGPNGPLAILTGLVDPEARTVGDEGAGGQ